MTKGWCYISTEHKVLKDAAHIHPKLLLLREVISLFGEILNRLLNHVIRELAWKEEGEMSLTIQQRQKAPRLLLLVFLTAQKY